MISKWSLPALTLVAGDGNYVMGSNNFGQLCVKPKRGNENKYSSHVFDIDERVVASFEATRFSSYVLYVDGSANGCGRNNHGQLGDGTYDDASLATVKLPRDREITRFLGVRPSAHSGSSRRQATGSGGQVRTTAGSLGWGTRRTATCRRWWGCRTRSRCTSCPRPTTTR